MSDPEAFVSRWLRRKREALRGTAAKPPPAVSAPAVDDYASDNAAPDDAPTPTSLAFDPATLPPIESITAETDIRAFLAPGVPSELARVALRRAWACDPNIRNFVGLADYDWDFNAVDSMAGFGPLRMSDEVTQMAAQIVQPNRSEPGACNPLDPAPTSPKAEQIAGKTDTDTARDAAAKMHDQAKHRNEPANEIGMPPHADELTHREARPAAAQYTAIKPDSRNVVVIRQHGRALPT
jgi:hypothetical protein